MPRSGFDFPSLKTTLLHAEAIHSPSSRQLRGCFSSGVEIAMLSSRRGCKLLITVLRFVRRVSRSPSVLPRPSMSVSRVLLVPIWKAVPVSVFCVHQEPFRLRGRQSARHAHLEPSVLKSVKTAILHALRVLQGPFLKLSVPCQALRVILV